MWDTASERPDPGIVDLARTSSLELVRYPGGTVANLFDWKRAIGPQDDRACQEGGGFIGNAQPLDSEYGPDEHMAFVASFDGQAQIMVPFANESPHDAADWVEYMNAPLGTNPNGGVAWAQVRAENGHSEPYGVQYWEIGNEHDRRGNQRYWMSQDDDVAVLQYAFGGSEPQQDERLGVDCDHRPSAGESDGSADQSFEVRFPPVMDGSQTVYVDGEAWEEVDDLSAAGPDDQVYEFAADSGQIRFGDGANGHVPAAGTVLTADYESGPHPGFVDFYTAMKEVDPTIDVCTAWGEPRFIEAMGTEHPYDCVAAHLYSRPDMEGAEEIYDFLMPDADLELELLVEIEAAMDEFGPTEDGPYLEVSEAGAFAAAGASDVGFPGFGGSVTHVLHSATLLTGFIERNVRYAEMSNLTANGRRAVGALFGGGPPFLNSARGQMYALVAELAGGRPMETAVRGNLEATGGGYEALRVTATRHEDGTVRLLVINRDREQDLATRIHLEGHSGTATVRTKVMNGPDITSVNRHGESEVVRTQVAERSGTYVDVGQRFDAHSITLVEIIPDERRN